MRVVGHRAVEVTERRLAELPARHARARVARQRLDQLVVRLLRVGGARLHHGAIGLDEQLLAARRALGQLGGARQLLVGHVGRVRLREQVVRERERVLLGQRLAALLARDVEVIVVERVGAAGHQLRHFQRSRRQRQPRRRRRRDGAAPALLLLRRRVVRILLLRRRVIRILLLRGGACCGAASARRMDSAGCCASAPSGAARTKTQTSDRISNYLQRRLRFWTTTSVSATVKITTQGVDTGAAPTRQPHPPARASLVERRREVARVRKVVMVRRPNRCARWPCPRCARRRASRCASPAPARACRRRRGRRPPASTSAQPPVYLGKPLGSSPSTFQACTK